MADDKKTQLGTGRARTPSDVQPSASASFSTSYAKAAEVDPLIGQTLADRYMIVKKLGEGGMGAVYLATHQILEKQVALKVLHGEFARKQDLVQRFMQEAKAASRIRHENVIDISDFGQTPDGHVFFAMELLKGHDLHDEVARNRLAGQLLPWSRTKPIFLQICAALIAAHKHGIVHRDLKPENIFLVEFLGEPDFVKLLDFGIAKLTELDGEGGERKLTRTGMLFGTPEYMSPEQARGDKVDHRVDIYSMGCILFQLVTGKVPFEAENFMGVLSQHLTEPPPTIAVEVFDQIGAPRALGAIITRALDKDRDTRWQTIAELANAIRTACGEPPVLDRGERAATPTGRESVTAPAVTTTATPVPALGTPVPVAASSTAIPATSGAGARQRTQWTGNLTVPQRAEPAPPPTASRMPLYLGLAAVVIAGGGVAAMFATRSHGDPPPPPAVASSPTPSPAPTPTPSPSAPKMVPAQVQIRIESTPSGAEVFDPSGADLGKTPLALPPMVPAQLATTYVLKLPGYVDQPAPITPDHTGTYPFTLSAVAKVTVGKRGGKQPPTTPPTTPTAPQTAPTTHPDTGPTTVPTNPPPTVPAIKPPPPPTDPNVVPLMNVPELKGSGS